MKKTRKRFTKEFKAQIIELVEAGRPAPEIAEDFDVEISCVYAWTRHIRNRGAKPPQDVADELRRLRR